MPGSTLQNSLVVLSLVTITAGAVYVGARADQPALGGAAQTLYADGVCYHTGVSDWVCPDSSMRFTPSADYITSVSVTLVTRDGMRKTVNLPQKVDAIFLTKEATEKFLMPYYWATNKTKAVNLNRALNAIR